MGSSSRPQTTTTRVDYPAWLEGPMRDNIARANEYADSQLANGYQGYNAADRIAGFNDLQTQAIGNIRGFSGSWLPMVQNAQNAMNQSNTLATQAATLPMNNYTMNAAYAGPGAMVQAGNLSQANLGAYMNPYTDHVTNNALGKIEESRQMQNLQNADSAQRARAFGGSRHGVVESQTNAAFGKQAADTALGAAQANFANAQAMATNDINRNLQAQGMNQNALNAMAQFNAGLGQQANQFNASQLQNADLAMRNFGLEASRTLGGNAQQNAQLASLYQNLGANDFNNLMTAGNMLQDQDQMGRDFAYQEWQNARNHPLDMLNLRYSAIHNTPYQPGSSSTSNIYRNRTQGFLGGAASGASAGSAFGPWGAAIGGLLGGFGGGWG